jgi:putative DNA primase/helicase
LLPQLRGAQELAEKIAKHKVRTDGCFCRQEIYLNGWSSLDTPEKAKQAAEVLADAGWIRELSGESSPLGGRPANRFAVNPKVSARRNPAHMDKQ